MEIMGIDEAGRGCVIGPLVMGAAVVTKEGWEELQTIGVKDSKKLSAKMRVELCEKIESVVTSRICIIEPSKIDEYTKKSSLNVLEMETMRDLLYDLTPQVVYVDALEKNSSNFLKKFSKIIGNLKVDIVAENKADDRYPVVAAASILAKVTRDEKIQELKEEWGDFGSGYPSDQKTVKFLRSYYQKHKSFPPIVRHTWKTIQKIVVGEQGTMFEEASTEKE